LKKIENSSDGRAKALYSLLRLGTADPSGVARRVSRGTRYEAQILEAHQPTFSAI